LQFVYLFCNLSKCILVFFSRISSLLLHSLLLPLLLLLLLTTAELSLGGSSPYTSTDKTNKNKYIKMYNVTIVDMFLQVLQVPSCIWMLSVIHRMACIKLVRYSG
jgi:hypothetical protein